MNRTNSLIGVLLMLAGCSTQSASSGGSSIAHLGQHGTIKQLVVDGKPYLVLGGELANTASSSHEYMAPVWPRLAKMHLNTVLTGMSWAQFEPVEGQFNYALVDDLLAGARAQNLKIVFIWFGSWKNGISSFAPAWVKDDQVRFPRVRLKSGKSSEVLSTLSEANLQADKKAYAAFMHHLSQVDASDHTVVMIQMENEVGVLGDSRDRSDAADAAYNGAVPSELIDYLNAHKDTLRPELKKLWDSAGDKTSGSWTQIFGEGTATDEAFMAWNYAHYMNQITAAGKAEYPVPVFTNTWINQPEDKGPGDWPSGCAEPNVLDIWRAGAPAIDMNCPDIYLPDFAGWIAKYHQNGNPLFVPESRGDAGGVANAFLAIGGQDGIGYSPFGIDSAERILAPPTGTAAAANPNPPTDVENYPLSRGYTVLGEMAPLILEHQGTRTIASVVVNAQQHPQTISMGNFTLNIDLPHNRRAGTVITSATPSYAMVISTGPNEYVIAANGVEITFSPNSPGDPIVGLAQVQAGTFANGKWIPGRWLNGDDILLNYHLAEAADKNQSGSGLRFNSDGPTIQKVELYRYK